MIDAPYDPDAPFNPDWTSPPGDTIKDVLEDRGITKETFIMAIGISMYKLQKLFTGEARITLALARKLSEVLGSTVEFWMMRDFSYWIKEKCKKSDS
ncbi:MAG: helix-turn-helix domain-containing protein [Bacteroidales bacterium]|jgi:HTH-type transcriptional regulator/antitoxin HigA